VSATAGKVCAVTGAGSGIGRALALGLARRGARLALSDVDAAGLEATAQAVRAARPGTEVDTRVVDVGDRDAVVAWADVVAARFGVVHQIHNNAGIAFARTVLESEWADYERALRVNLWGVIHGTKAFLPHLIASGDGHVVNVSSANGFLAQGEASHYVTSKFAVRGFTESLRVEMLHGGHRVGVTSVHPGGVRTAIADNALSAARALGLEVTDAHEARRRLYNERVLRLDPAAAAETIIAGVERGRGRVLVGTDARLADAFVRLLPERYPGLVAAAERRWRP